MYDTPIQQQYAFNNVNFDGADIVHSIAVPIGPNRGKDLSHSPGVGMQGKVTRVLVHNVTADFSDESTAAIIRIGDGSDVDKYFDSGTSIGDTLDIGEDLVLTDDGAAVEIEEGRTEIVVTCVAGTGGTPDTGIADLTVDIDWY